MLGELFGEHKDKIIGQRVVDINGEGPKIEITFSADAKIKGTIDINELGTYSSVVRPRGILYGEGQGLYTAKDGSGEMATWTGYGIGRFTGPAGGGEAIVVHYFIEQIQLENYPSLIISLQYLNTRQMSQVILLQKYGNGNKKRDR
jgi:hypothetical protein